MTSIAATISAPRGTRGPRLGWALSAFIWLLPFHILAMALLFGWFGLPAIVVRAAAAWKEVLAALLAALALAHALGGAGARSPVAGADIVVGGLGVVALAYLVGADVWFGGGLPMGAQLLGWRDAAFFTVVYFVGRATPAVADERRYLRSVVAVGVVTSFVAIVERLLVTPDMLIVLGVARYIQDLLSLAITTVHNPYGLPDSYWTSMGGHLVQRAGSTYLSSQGFAVPFLVILPAATVALFTAKSRRGWAWAAYAVLWTGLLLTITRMTTVVCGLQVIVLAALYRRWGITVGAALLVVLGATGAALVVPGFATFMLETLTWETASSVSHLEDWGAGALHLLEHPFGIGLGGGGLTAARFGLPPVAADSQYFKYAVELGVLGLILYLGTLAALSAAGVRAFATARTETVRAQGAVVAVAVLGIALNGITTVLLSNPFLTYTVFWLAGTTVSVAGDRT